MTTQVLLISALLVVNLFGENPDILDGKVEPVNIDLSTFHNNISIINLSLSGEHLWLFRGVSVECKMVCNNTALRKAKDLI